ncbi:MAG: hypothetical protein AAGE84_30750 [Cyanobacteria bacterium P01_G01_bin.39]
MDKSNAEYPFSNKLAWEYRWSRIYTWRAIQEYKKFIFIGMVADCEITPSTVVDRVWHLHLTHTYSYWQEFCGEVLGKPYHHFPSLGGENEGYRYLNNYERTLKIYHHYFGQPPTDIWNEPKLSGEKVSCQWIDREHYWLIPKNIISLKSIFSIINKQIEILILNTSYSQL